MLETFQRTYASQRQRTQRVDWDSLELPGKREGYTKTAYTPDTPQWFRAKSSFAYRHPSTVLVERVVFGDDVSWEQEPKDKKEPHGDKGADSHKTSYVIRRMELSTGGFLELLFSDRWPEGSVLRVLQGRLLDDLLHALTQLQMFHDVVRYTTLAVLRLPRPLTPCIKRQGREGTGKPSTDEDGNRSEKVFVEFNIFSAQQCPLARVTEWPLTDAYKAVEEESDVDAALEADQGATGDPEQAEGGEDLLKAETEDDEPSDVPEDDQAEAEAEEAAPGKKGKKGKGKGAGKGKGGKEKGGKGGEKDGGKGGKGSEKDKGGKGAKGSEKGKGAKDPGKGAKGSEKDAGKGGGKGADKATAAAGKAAKPAPKKQGGNKNTSHPIASRLSWSGSTFSDSSLASYLSRRGPDKTKTKTPCVEVQASIGDYPQKLDPDLLKKMHISSFCIGNTDGPKLEPDYAPTASMLAETPPYNVEFMSDSTRKESASSSGVSLMTQRTYLSPDDQEEKEKKIRLRKRTVLQHLPAHRAYAGSESRCLFPEVMPCNIRGLREPLPHLDCLEPHHVISESLMERRLRQRSGPPHTPPPPIVKKKEIEPLPWADRWMDDFFLGPKASDGTDVVASEPFLDEYSADEEGETKRTKTRAAFFNQRVIIENENRRVQSAKKLTPTESKSKRGKKKKDLDEISMDGDYQETVLNLDPYREKELEVELELLESEFMPVDRAPRRKKTNIKKRLKRQLRLREEMKARQLQADHLAKEQQQELFKQQQQGLSKQESKGYKSCLSTSSQTPSGNQSESSGVTSSLGDSSSSKVTIERKVFHIWDNPSVRMKKWAKCPEFDEFFYRLKGLDDVKTSAMLKKQKTSKKAPDDPDDAGSDSSADLECDRPGSHARLARKQRVDIQTNAMRTPANQEEKSEPGCEERKQKAGGLSQGRPGLGLPPALKRQGQLKMQAMQGTTYLGTRLLAEEQKGLVRKRELAISEMDPWHVSVRFAQLADGVRDSIDLRNDLLRRRERIHWLTEEGKRVLALNKTRIWSFVRKIPKDDRRKQLHIVDARKHKWKLNSSDRALSREESSSPRAVEDVLQVNEQLSHARYLRLLGFRRPRRQETCVSPNRQLTLIDDSKIPKNVAPADLFSIMEIGREFNIHHLKSTFSFEHMFGHRQKSVPNYTQRLAKYQHPATKKKPKPVAKSAKPKKTKPIHVEEVVIEPEVELSPPPFVLGKLKEFKFLEQKDYMPEIVVAAGGLHPTELTSEELFDYLLLATQVFIVRKEKATTIDPCLSKLSVTFTRRPAGEEVTKGQDSVASEEESLTRDEEVTRGEELTRDEEATRGEEPTSGEELTSAPDPPGADSFGAVAALCETLFDV